MEQYISKDALVREIEKQRNAYISEPSKYRVLSRILSLIDTLEVKEVDLEKEIKEQIDTYYENCNKKLEKMGEDDNDISFLTLDGFARYFYELGLKAQKEKTELLKVRGYLVRDKDDYTAIYAEKPHRGKTEWVNGKDSCLMTINDARLVPDIEFEDEPVEVEVTLKRLNTEE